MSDEQREQLEMVEQRVRESMAQIPHKILVMSGKGGVGKTTVAVNLAYALSEDGLEVGLLDVDLHGPNVALMTGLEGQSGEVEDERLVPVRAADGVRVLSIAFFIPHQDAPIVWRGPRKSGAIRQLLADGDWRGVDVLVVDCPPGTGDEPLSVAQLIPEADGVIVVTSPQQVALLDSRKCVHFVEQLGLPVLGVVENLSGFVCPSCGDRLDLFTSGGGQRAAEELGVGFLGRVPISAAMVAAGDGGMPLVTSAPQDPAAVALREIARAVVGGWGRRETSKGDDIMEETKLVAVATEDDRALHGEVSMHFGRCPFYTLVVVKDGQIVGARVEANPHFGEHQPGVMPRYIHGLGANVILAGGMGPRAVELFEAFGVDVATGAVGRVGKVVEAYLEGRLKGTVPCQHDHAESCGGHGH